MIMYEFLGMLRFLFCFCFFVWFFFFLCLCVWLDLHHVSELFMGGSVSVCQSCIYAMFVFIYSPYMSSFISSIFLFSEQLQNQGHLLESGTEMYVSSLFVSLFFHHLTSFNIKSSFGTEVQILIPRSALPIQEVYFQNVHGIPFHFIRVSDCSSYTFSNISLSIKWRVFSSSTLQRPVWKSQKRKRCFQPKFLRPRSRSQVEWLTQKA